MLANIFDSSLQYLVEKIHILMLVQSLPFNALHVVVCIYFNFLNIELPNKERSKWKTYTGSF